MRVSVKNRNDFIDFQLSEINYFKNEVRYIAKELIKNSIEEEQIVEGEITDDRIELFLEEIK
jgi:hypothetical protein